MRKIIPVVSIVLLLSFACYGQSENTETPGSLAIWSIAEIINLFDDYTKEVSGAGWVYGVKSQLMDWGGMHDPWIKLKVQTVWTPANLELESRSDGGEFDEARFLDFTKLMPTRYDTYNTVRTKINECLRLICPGRDDNFYTKIMSTLREKTGADWL